MITSTQERFAGGRSKGPQPVAARRPRRPSADDGEVTEGEGGYNRGRKRTGVRLTVRGGLPETVAGKVIAALVGVAIVGAAAGGALATERMMQRDQRFRLPDASAIETVGNARVSRAEMVGALHDDIGRNVFSLSLPEQQRQLQAIPWVERATVMRLLPDRLRASVAERTPVAFVREHEQIGLVDASGVLLDLRQAGPGSSSYSFPVVTGIMAADPASQRAARMKIFAGFVAALDATGEHISAKLSEVDLSDPEDVKALIPDSGAEVMVHFGDAAYLDRYRNYEAHLAEWRAQYPKLASVDMRYDRQVVLEMQAGAEVPVNTAKAAPTVEVSDASKAKAAKPRPRHRDPAAAAPAAQETAPTTASEAVPASGRGHGLHFGDAVKHLAAKVVHR